MTGLSGSGAKERRPRPSPSRRGGSADAGVRAPGGRLARTLLLGMVMCAFALGQAACPYPDVAFAANQPPLITWELLDPLTQAEQSCGPSSTDLLTFDATKAITDPDGDDLRYVWLLNFDSEHPAGSLGDDGSLELSCQDARLEEGKNRLELIAMDRPPKGLTGERARVPEDGGFAVIVTWVIVVKQ